MLSGIVARETAALEGNVLGPSKESGTEVYKKKHLLEIGDVRTRQKENIEQR